MALSPETESVLRAIFAIGSDRESEVKTRPRVHVPGADELFSLCELLADQPVEEDLQVFLEKNAGFLTGIIGTVDNSDLSVIFKPKIGTQYCADFCLLQSFQGGSVCHLIEIETSHEKLFTQDLKPAKRLAGAILQVENWRAWINRNAVHYAKELIRVSRDLPLYQPGVEFKSGFRLRDADAIESTWQAFGGFDEPFFTYTIIIGRWSELERGARERLVQMNNHGQSNLRIFTYEQVARVANYRLDKEEF